MDIASHFQVRLDESASLKALFEKVFFDVPYPPEALQALERTRFRPGRGGEGAAPRKGSGGEAEPFGDQPRTILLYRGESGIGKTLICRQFRAYAADRRIPVYEIHCHDVEGIPFKPFLRVIREILADFEFGDLLSEKYRPGLEGLLPEVFRSGSGAPEAKEPFLDWRGKGGWEEDKVRIFDGITQLLFEITALHPVVILVHDLNWGDQATIELLRYIGRNIQLRNSQAAHWRSRALPFSSGLDWASGEDGLEDPERVDLRAAGSRDVLRSLRGAWTGGQGSQPGPARPAGRGERVDDRPVRLMILGNYRGSPMEENYLERSLRSLGEEPFAYHGEIRTLELEDTRGFFERCMAESGGSGAAATVEPEAVARIQTASEGFPSFIHELLRLVRAKEPGIERLTPEAIDRVLGDGDAPAGLAWPRHRILERRLLEVDAEELAVLQALALARKPLTRDFLSRVVDLPPEDLEQSLQSLENQAFIEKVGQLFHRGGEEDGWYFRIWDYTVVVGEAIADADRRRGLHQRIGSELRSRAERPEDEKAYEIFYHLRRGSEPRSAVEFGLVAARRFARSFSIEKAALVLEEILSILDGGADRETRLKLLEEKAAYHLALKQFQKAEESLRKLLDEGGSDIPEPRRAELLIREGEVHRLAGDTNRALKVLSKAFKHVRDVNSFLAVSWHLATARVRRDRSDHNRAINLCLKGIKIGQKALEDPGSGETVDEAAPSPPGPLSSPPKGAVELAELHHVLAQVFHHKGNNAHAVDNFQRSLDEFERLGDEAAAARVLDDLGKVYLESGNYFRAARYFFKALEINRRNQDIAGLCRSYDQLGLVYLRTGDELKTIEHLNYSIQLKERIGDLEGLNPTLKILGDLYFRLGRYQRAMQYYRWEVQNSQALTDTRGLVDAFIHLGWVTYEIGDRRQLQNLTRQIGILASEFKLREQEAGGARLQGVLEAFLRNWNEAEAQLKSALEIYSKLGHRRREAEVLLDQAQVKYARESYGDALKLASKALVLADQLKAVDLQVRAHVIKGNVNRFINGGNLDKAKEGLRKALELGESLNDVHCLFDAYYSLAKAYHYDREFIEAGIFYGKAEAIIRRIADELPADQSPRYLEDPRRKLFLEDANRFRKEVAGRSAGTNGDARERSGAAIAAEARERPVGLEDYKELNARLLRVNNGLHAPEFFDLLIREAADLAKAERGFLLRVQNRQYTVAAHHGFGAGPDGHPDFPSAQSLAEETVRKGKTHLSSGAEQGSAEEGALHPGGPLHRTSLVVPLATPERIFGAMYLDRPMSIGKFSSRDQILIEALAAHGGAILDNRRRFEAAILEPFTGLYTTSHFLDRLKERFRMHSLHGRPFFLVGFYLPTLESGLRDEARLLGEQLGIEVREELPAGAIACWGSPIVSVLITDLDFAATDQLAQNIEGRLLALVNSRVTYVILAPEARIPNGVAMYFELRRRLLPEESDQQTMLEIRQLLSRDITLKDAKRILEKHIIENTLRKTGGNITHAAKELGIHRPQLSNLLKKYALKRERFERGLDLDLDPHAN